MTFLDHVRLMAAYNAWMNERLYAAVETLDADARWAERGAFFGSVMGTLNHLMVADLIWISRMADHPRARPALDAPLAMATPTRLDETLHRDFDPLRTARTAIDDALVAFAAALADTDLDIPLVYSRTNGEAQKRVLGPVLSHLFNHQTHHRGQITTLLFQAGIDPGVTDLLVLTPNLA